MWCGLLCYISLPHYIYLFPHYISLSPHTSPHTFPIFLFTCIPDRTCLAFPPRTYRGSARRGIDFEGAIKWKMGEVELKDQVRAIQAYSVRKSYSVKNTDSRQIGKKGSGLVDLKKVFIFTFIFIYDIYLFRCPYKRTAPSPSLTSSLSPCPSPLFSLSFPLPSFYPLSLLPLSLPPSLPPSYPPPL